MFLEDRDTLGNLLEGFNDSFGNYYADMVYDAGIGLVECTFKEALSFAHVLDCCGKYGIDYVMFEYGEDSPEEYYETRNEMPLHGIIDIDDEGRESELKLIKILRLENIKCTDFESYAILKILREIAKAKIKKEN